MLCDTIIFKQSKTLSGHKMLFGLSPLGLFKPSQKCASRMASKAGDLSLKISFAASNRKTRRDQRSWYFYRSTFNTLFFISALVLLNLSVTRVHAALSYEIAVFTDELVATGEIGTQLHINSTPQGLSVPTYAGEIMNVHGQRLTPDFSYGLNRTVEAGLMLPMTRTNSGTLTEAGYIARLKYLPLQSLYGEGAFAGLNMELGQLKPEFELSKRFYEMRYIMGWKNADWLFSFNPIFNWPISTGYVEQSPHYTATLKGSYKFTASSRYGLEYYSAKGQINNLTPYKMQNNTLYLVWDFDRKPYEINLGVGRGLNGSSDAWTVKSVVAWPF